MGESRIIDDTDANGTDCRDKLSPLHNPDVVVVGKTFLLDGTGDNRQASKVIFKLRSTIGFVIRSS
jgi:hypothetical protein